jgi:hypothetical protein
MDLKALIQTLAGVTPQNVAQTQNDLRSGKYKGASALTGDAMGPSLGGLLKLVPGVMKNGTKLLTRISTVEDIPKRMLAYGDEMSKLANGAINPAKAVDWSKPATKAAGSRSNWDVINGLVKKGKTRKALGHANKGPMTFLDGN